MNDYEKNQLRARSYISEVVEMDPKFLGGIPRLRGTRYAVSQLFAELRDGSSIEEICENDDLDIEIVRKYLSGMSILYDIRDYDPIKE